MIPHIPERAVVRAVRRAERVLGWMGLISLLALAAGLALTWSLTT